MTRLNSEFDTKDDIILRDFLALERTTLANERTLFSYIRTSLYLVLAGIGFIKLKEFADLTWVGYITIPISIVVIVYGFIRYSILQKKLHKFYESIDEKKIREDK